ncbi:hypothetical protein EHQ24_11885 [Leptospira noumeaensis]|uniref:Lipoprotein n=1 Tax=Leptospira noumeaensis TaxID=2484964 RepID=A0A4R9I767_9LEPT|nr:hypothetical protein [Leptospira noumeaensis]TGK81975.1 hypothetical protein EHQ24_11885 [Leptospira noumeaensis]
MKIKFSNRVSLSIISFLISFIVFNCKTLETRLLDPANSAEEKEQTLVGFLLLDDEKSDAKASATLEVTVQALDASNFSINMVTEKEGDKVKDAVPMPSEILYHEEEELSYVTYSKFIKNTFAGFVLDSNKEYYIGRMSWSRYCGDRCKTLLNLSLEPQISYDTLKIKGKPGEIVFLGVYMINAIQDKESKSFFSNKVKIKPEFEKIEKDSPIWNKKFPNYIQSHLFDSESGINEKSAEIKFLLNIINVQKKGYWKEKAEKRLNELLKS